MREEYRAFRTAGNKLAQSFIFGDEADAKVIQARAEIATRTDGAKKAIKGDRLLDCIENGSIDRPASYDAALTRAKTYRKDGKMVGELIHVRERSTEAAYVTK